MSDLPVTLENVGNVLEEIEDAFFDIPFENSDFQTRAFVVASQQTPARAYRAIGLQMFSKIQAVKEYQFNKAMADIDLDEKQARLNDPATSEFDRRRLQLEIIKINDGRRWAEKLASDAIHTLNVLYSELKKYPAFSKEQFENEEALHFEMKLTRQIQAPGAHESLANMKIDLRELDNRLALVTTALIGGKE